MNQQTTLVVQPTTDEGPMCLNIGLIEKISIIPGTTTIRVEYDDPQYGSVYLDIVADARGYKELQEMILEHTTRRAGVGNLSAPIPERLQKALISFKRGEMFLQVSLASKDPLETRSTAFCVDRKGVKVTTADSSKNRALTLTLEEGLLLAEALTVVNAYWHEDRLPIGHVLLDCGHIVHWNSLKINRNPSAFYALPSLGFQVHCESCEQPYQFFMDVYRFFPEDFLGAEEEGVE